MPTVAISTDFLDAFSRIPRAQQKKVREFTEKFQIDPTQHSINYEPIKQALDNKVRTVRIGDDYRAVVVHPSKGDLYLLVWVDHHDEAITWTRNRRFEVHSATGALQVVQSTVVNLTEKVVDNSNGRYPDGLATRMRRPPLFEQYDDEALLYLGVPSSIIPTAKNIRTDEELESLQKNLPVEAYENLLMLAAGFTIEEVLAEFSSNTPGEVDTDDFQQALQRPDSKRRFAIITSAEELEQILNEPLVKWRIFLHPSQEKIARGDFNGPVRVTGGAGTGKTVVAMHRACFLARERFSTPGDLILFTTFTRNLARSIDGNLKTLCTDEEKGRIEVVNLHAWAYNFLRKYGVNLDLIVNTDTLWQEVVQSIKSECSFSFLREEWEQVIYGQDISTLEEYMRTPRLGRGTRLLRPQREVVWRCFEAYQKLLKLRNGMDGLGMINLCRQFIQSNNIVLSYKAVIVDEAQDLHPEELRLIRALVPSGPNDLFIVGDSHQRIYNRKVILSKCGIQCRGNRSRTLKINYRTTEEIRQWSMALLNGSPFDNLDGDLESEQGYMSLMNGIAPKIIMFPDAMQESDYIAEYIKKQIDVGVPAHNICVVTRTRRLMDEIYKPALRAAGLQVVILDGRDLDEGEGVRLATMHRVKGLEFEQVFLAAINRGVMPLEKALKSSADRVALIEAEMRERSLLYVAATRARNYLHISFHGTPSRFFDEYNRG